MLEPGTHEVGRGSECAVHLDDATVSRHQLSIAVFPDLTVQLVPDPDAANPLTVNGRTISEPTFVGRNDVVQFGATAIALRIFSRSSDTERDQLGQVPFRRTPYKPVVVHDRSFGALGRIPTRPEKTRMAAAPIVAPIVMGLALYALTRSPYMLMTIALSPAMVIFNQLGGRKTGRQKYEAQVDRAPRAHRQAPRRDRLRPDRRARRAHRPVARSRRSRPPGHAAHPRPVAAPTRRRRVPPDPARARNGALPRQGRAGDVRRRRAVRCRERRHGGVRPAGGGADLRQPERARRVRPPRTPARRGRDVLVGADPGGHAAQPRGPRHRRDRGS